MNGITTWRMIANCLDKNIPVMLLYVLESKGSSPGRQGFFMAVSADGKMEGSIGGGIMEHKFVELAKEQLGVSESSVQIRKQFHDKIAGRDQSGMICSGEQTLLLYPVRTKDMKPVRQLIASLEQHKNGALMLSPAGIAFHDAEPVHDYHFALRSNEDWEYIEKTGYKQKLFVIGGGHCALAFSRLMRDLDFYIILYDDRPGLKTMMENDAVHEKHLVKDFSELGELVPGGSNHYVVIMTMGYRTDDIALRALAQKEFAYLGVLGSRSKIQKMIREYGTTGMEQNFRNEIHAPVGLDIKSQTPGEIAVSIAAEIIQVKNRNF